MTRRTFITAPVPPDDAERFIRTITGRPPVEPEHEHEQRQEPERKAPPAAPHGARDSIPRPGNDADAFLRAMSYAAITGDPDWINRLQPGSQPIG